jgi:transcriptional regulator with XRE-family HTH domain
MKNEKLFLRLREAHHVTEDKQLAKILGVAATVIATWKKGANRPNYELIFSKSESTGVNLHWLLTGEGEMFFEKQKNSTPETHEAPTAYNASAPDYARIGKMLVDVVAAAIKATTSAH